MGRLCWSSGLTASYPNRGANMADIELQWPSGERVYTNRVKQMAFSADLRTLYPALGLGHIQITTKQNERNEETNGSATNDIN
jgi:hypothetical protein